MSANIVSLSGGKDSTALALLAIEHETPALTFAFADTGHEHPQTLEYIEYLDAELKARCGVGVRVVRADFTEKMRYRREHIQEHWQRSGVAQERIDRAKALMHPTGNPFLDLCLLRARFPSTQARFCTQELKHFPLTEQVLVPATRSHDQVWSWQGVRRDESRTRANLSECENDPLGWRIYRPILDWSAADCFAMHKKHGMRWNPLYEQGMSRVGCMPCIHVGKTELREIAKRFPEELERLADWERLVGEVSKRGVATFFGPDKTPGHVSGNCADDPQSAYGIAQVIQWTKTARGGHQYDLVLAAEDDAQCSSVYGLCE